MRPPSARTLRHACLCRWDRRHLRHAARESRAQIRPRDPRRQGTGAPAAAHSATTRALLAPTPLTRRSANSVTATLANTVVHRDGSVVEFLAIVRGRGVLSQRDRSHSTETPKRRARRHIPSHLLRRQHSRSRKRRGKRERRQRRTGPCTRLLASIREGTPRLSPDIPIFCRPRPSDHKVHSEMPMSNAAPPLAPTSRAPIRSSLRSSRKHVGPPCAVKRTALSRSPVMFGA